MRSFADRHCSFRLPTHAAMLSAPVWLIALGTVSTPVAAQALDKPTERTTFCANTTCHASIVARKVTHGPEAQLECQTCHEFASPEQHLFRLTSPKKDLCRGCHSLHLDSVVHLPVTEGDCTGCHDPHGSDHGMMLLKEPGDGLCFLCHDQSMIKQEFVHGPVAVQACVVCHESHSSGNPKLLTVAPSRLCIGCHAELEPRGAEARHLHKPLDDGCTSCHDPHASAAKFQLRSDTPDLCFTCHEGLKSDVESATVVHGPVMESGGCAGCHDPHFTSLARLQRSPQPQLCLDCHDEAIVTKDGRTLTDMRALLEEHSDHHGPIRDGGCTACHQPHSGAVHRLLIKEYPSEFYAPFEMARYDLCFSCHISDLVKDKSGRGLTKFRNGDLNLHWLHVNQEKGRTCRACHEVHASSRPFHVRESVPYGTTGWMLEINYERNDDGGSCLPGCHRQRGYGRTAPVASDAAIETTVPPSTGGTP